jgi:hypothetical protein
MKALENCATLDSSNCKNCPCFDTCNECDGTMTKAVLDLIKRQQAEIEQLRQLFVESGKEQDRLMAEIERLEEDKERLYVIGYNLAENEAIKEFADRLKKKLFKPLGTWIFEKIVTESNIDNLVKEMTE